MTEDNKELDNTTLGDDMDMLVNAIYQLSDMIEEDPCVSVPDPGKHCKYWSEISASDLAKKMERKYSKAPRTKIPEAHLTSY